MPDLGGLGTRLMAGAVKYILRHPGVMDSRPFLWLMATFPAVISKSYDARVVRGGSHYAAPLKSGLRRLAGTPARILDVCTGTGFAAFAAAEAFPAALIQGVDQSPAMIQIAIAKAAAAGNSNMSFAVGNARRLPHANGEFDLVVTSNAPVYLDELARVLKPGGFLLAAYSFGGDAFVRAKSELAIYLARGGFRLTELTATEGGGVYVIATRTP